MVLNFARLPLSFFLQLQLRRNYECGVEGRPSLTIRKAMEQNRMLKTTVRKERMNRCDPWDGKERSCENKIMTSPTRTETVHIKKPKQHF
jgi:hypothetical protein